MDAHDDADVCVHGHLRQIPRADVSNDAGRMGPVLLSSPDLANRLGPENENTGQNRQFAVPIDTLFVPFGRNIMLFHWSQYCSVGRGQRHHVYGPLAGHSPRAFYLERKSRFTPMDVGFDWVCRCSDHYQTRT